MQSVKRLLLLCTTALIVLLSCQKELSSNEFIPINTGNSPNITATVQGRIVDELGNPVSGAEVRTSLLSVFTDINGEFRMQNTSLYNDASFIQVVKTGYFTGSRTFISRGSESHYIEVKLLPKTTSGVVNSAGGGTVTLNNGAAVTLPASAVVNKINNTPYAGKIGVSIAWIDPTSADLTREMPGDLRGQGNSSAQVGLQSFGMLAVELKGNGGEDLQVAPGKKASLKFPLPAAIASTAPATIALWSFNETTGLWKQEGTATKTGNFYEGEVSHFSFWNCDAYFPVVDFTATLKDQNSAPLRHTLVKLKRSTPNSYTTAYTDSSGVVKGKVPSNETLTLEVLNNCNMVIYSQAVGPYTAAASVNITATVTNVQAATITGNVINCTGTPVTTGSVELLINQRVYRAKLISGAFTLNISTCSNNQPATIVSVDSTTNQQGTASVTINQGANNAGTLTACGLSASQFINFSVGGTPYSITPPLDSLELSHQTSFTGIRGTRFSNSNNSGTVNSFISMYLTFNGNTVGSYQSQNVFVSVPFPVIDSAMLQAPATINITEYGNIGEYVAGSLVGVLKGTSTSSTYPLQCTFRVKRKN